MTKFFWGRTGGVKCKHWVTWDAICYLILEGEIGIRSLFDVSKVLFANLWWIFRVKTNSMWGTFGSHILKKLVEVREEVEHLIWWQVRDHSYIFWHDNWTQQGALYYIEAGGLEEPNLKVKDFIDENGWISSELKDYISEELADHIIECIKPQRSECRDNIWWMGIIKGEFSVRFSFHLLRKKRDEWDWLANIWKGLPFKMNFFLWRVWKKRIAIDDNLKQMKMNIVLRCYWCETF